MERMLFALLSVLSDGNAFSSVGVCVCALRVVHVGGYALYFLLQVYICWRFYVVLCFFFSDRKILA
jgi:hypothetical protein